MGAEKVFADFAGTKRADLRDMLDFGGLRKGDTLLLRQVSDLGRGAEVARLQRRIAEIGATIEIVPGEASKRVAGRKPRMAPTDEQKEHLCALWYSAAPQKWVLERASDKMGGPVTRDQKNRWCGARHGKSKEGSSDAKTR